MIIETVIVGLLMFAIIGCFVTVTLTIFDTVERFGDELHNYFEDPELERNSESKTEVDDS